MTTLSTRQQLYLQNADSSVLRSTTELFRITVKQYHEMINAGILSTADRVELLDGFLVPKMSQNSPHSSATQKLAKLLIIYLFLKNNNDWQVRSQLPVTLQTSEPEPDLAIVKGANNAFDLRHPAAADFGIVVEVADSSLGIDQGGKLEIYAKAGIPCYWIVNIQEKQIEVYTQPKDNTYQSKTLYTSGESCPVVLAGETVGMINVSEVLTN